MTYEEELQQDKQLLDLQRKLSMLNSKYKTALSTISKLEATLNSVLEIDQTFDKQRSFRLSVAKDQSGPAEAIPILLWSDWHVGETVNPSTVNYKNEFNPEICRQRAITLFNNTARTINMLKTNYTIKNIVLWLGGDFISGYIHEELMESNSMSPIQEINFVGELITDGIDYLLKTTGVDNIIIPCNFGNHGRLTEKTRFSTGHINNLEWGLYNSLAKQYRDNKQVTFYVSDGYAIHLELWGRVLRFTHGDAVKCGGGSASLINAANRWIAKQDQTHQADMTFMGHFHTTVFDKKLTVNNCLVGASPYSTRLGFPVEPADQALVLLEKDKGFTIC